MNHPCSTVVGMLCKNVNIMNYPCSTPGEAQPLETKLFHFSVKNSIKGVINHSVCQMFYKYKIKIDLY